MTDTEITTDPADDVENDIQEEVDQPDPDPAEDELDDQPDDEADTFPREVVEKLRQENGRYRQRAQRADDLAHRLHTELVRATGKLADPTDLDYAEEHLDDVESLSTAIDELLDRKPHLASRRPSGDIGQGNRGNGSEPVSLLGLLKERT